MKFDACNVVVLQSHHGRASLVIEIEANLENGQLTTAGH